MKRFFCQRKWRSYHPTAFARFEELVRNEWLLLDELMAWHDVARAKHNPLSPSIIRLNA